MIKDLTISGRQELIKAMPKKFSGFSNLSSLICVFRDESLIEIVIGENIYLGKCFINTEKREMYWRPQHRWYVQIHNLGCFSYDLLKDKKARIVPTDIQVNTFMENKVKEIMKRGRLHLRETQKAYLDLENLRKIPNPCSKKDEGEE